MIRPLKRPGYRLHAPASPEAAALLAEQGLTAADLDRALARLEAAEGTRITALVGLNEGGVFGTGPDGRNPAAVGPAPVIPVLWLRVLKLLDRVRPGSTARFLRDRLLPGEPPPGAAGDPTTGAGVALALPEP